MSDNSKIQWTQATWNPTTGCDLLAVPAAVRFVSLEPLLGPLPALNLDGIGWAIVGGESGKGARPMELAWAREIVQQCRRSGAAPFVKQLGAVLGRQLGGGGHGSDWDTWPADLKVREFPHGAGGTRRGTCSTSGAVS